MWHLCRFFFMDPFFQPSRSKKKKKMLKYTTEDKLLQALYYFSKNDHLSSRICNWERIVSAINSIRKTGYPHAGEENRTLI